jgi:hypothetical protein
VTRSKDALRDLDRLNDNGVQFSELFEGVPTFPCIPTSVTTDQGFIDEVIRIGSGPAVAVLRVGPEKSADLNLKKRLQPPRSGVRLIVVIPTELIWFVLSG